MHQRWAQILYACRNAGVSYALRLTLDRQINHLVMQICHSECVRARNIHGVNMLKTVNMVRLRRS